MIFILSVEKPESGERNKFTGDIRNSLDKRGLYCCQLVNHISEGLTCSQARRAYLGSVLFLEK